MTLSLAISIFKSHKESGIHIKKLYYSFLMYIATEAFEWTWIWLIWSVGKSAHIWRVNGAVALLCCNVYLMIKATDGKINYQFLILFYDTQMCMIKTVTQCRNNYTHTETCPSTPQLLFLVTIFSFFCCLNIFTIIPRGLIILSTHAE